MKTLFCDDCIREILETVEHQLIEEFFIYDTEERQFYPIDDGTTIQIGDYSLEIEYKNSERHFLFLLAPEVQRTFLYNRRL